jgi:hypothetical protein
MRNGLFYSALTLTLALLASCDDAAEPVADVEGETQDAGAAGAGGSAGQGGSGGTAGAGGFPCAAPPEDVSASPRADERIETLALSLSPGLVARQEDYDRIARDVAAIEALDASLREIPVYFANAGFGRVVWVSLSTPDLPTTGPDAAAWECLNTAMGVESVEPDTWLGEGPGVWSGTLTFRGLFRAEVLAEVYAALPFVRRAGAYVPGGGDGPTICLTPGASDWRYFFDRADGDCEAGCGSHQITGFSVSIGGEVTPLGVWIAPTQDSEPWPEGLYEELRAAGCFD